MSQERLSRLAQHLRAWAERSAAVRALFWYGGYGYGQLLPGSDLDVAVLLHPGADISQVSEDLLSALGAQGEPVEYRVIDPGERRLTAWVGEAMLKLDAVFGRAAEELAWLSDAIDVPPPRLTSAWPVQQPDVVDLLQRARRAIPESDVLLRRERCEQESDKFLVAFEACSAAHARGDAYAFYFQYNLALGRLARLVQLTRAGHRHLYLPRQFFSGLLSPEERESFRGLAATLQLAEAPDRKRALARAFLQALEQACVTLTVRRDPGTLDTFLTRIQHRDLPCGEERP